MGGDDDPGRTAARAQPRHSPPGDDLRNVLVSLRLELDARARARLARSARPSAKRGGRLRGQRGGRRAHAHAAPPHCQQHGLHPDRHRRADRRASARQGSGNRDRARAGVRPPPRSRHRAGRDRRRRQLRLAEPHRLRRLRQQPLLWRQWLADDPADALVDQPAAARADRLLGAHSARGARRSTRGSGPAGQRRPRPHPVRPADPARTGQAAAGLSRTAHRHRHGGRHAPRGGLSARDRTSDRHARRSFAAQPANEPRHSGYEADVQDQEGDI